MLVSVNFVILIWKCCCVIPWWRLAAETLVLSLCVCIKFNLFVQACGSDYQITTPKTKDLKYIWRQNQFVKIVALLKKWKSAHRVIKM